MFDSQETNQPTISHEGQREPTPPPMTPRQWSDGLRKCLRVGHVAYDIRAAQKDINVIFPLTRFRELAQQGMIGALAERNYFYHGMTNIPRLVQERAPRWAQMLKEDGVDAVFLTPG